MMKCFYTTIAFIYFMQLRPKTLSACVEQNESTANSTTVAASSKTMDTGERSEQATTAQSTIDSIQEVIDKMFQNVPTKDGSFDSGETNSFENNQRKNAYPSSSYFSNTNPLFTCQNYPNGNQFQNYQNQQLLTQSNNLLPNDNNWNNYQFNYEISPSNKDYGGLDINNPQNPLTNDYYANMNSNQYNQDILNNNNNDLRNSGSFSYSYANVNSNNPNNFFNKIFKQNHSNKIPQMETTKLNLMPKNQMSYPPLYTDKQPLYTRSDKGNGYWDANNQWINLANKPRRKFLNYETQQPFRTGSNQPLYIDKQPLYTRSDKGNGYWDANNQWINLPNKPRRKFINYETQQPFRTGSNPSIEMDQLSALYKKAYNKFYGQPTAMSLNSNYPMQKNSPFASQSFLNRNQPYSNYDTTSTTMINNGIRPSSGSHYKPQIITNGRRIEMPDDHIYLGAPLMGEEYQQSQVGMPIEQSKIVFSREPTLHPGISQQTPNSNYWNNNFLPGIQSIFPGLFNNENNDREILWQRFPQPIECR